MPLIDHVTIEVRSGKGGDGHISFLHDKVSEFGGPDGGNGGRGGSIYLIACHNINNLFRYRHSYCAIAEDGEVGHKKNMYGRNAKDIYIEVPVGTVAYLQEDHRLIADLKKEGDVVMVAKGGRGGRGNACFKSSRNRVPRIAENGHPGEVKKLILELKSIADAGIIGFPSVGKSTFLNVVTRANVQAADYWFTTKVPNLGVVDLGDGQSFVLADMPGLIEGAHEGKGLGLEFLRHIERCRVLMHFVSMSGERDPYEDYQIINEELKGYGANLDQRPQIVVATKMDEEGAEERKEEFDKKIGFKSLPLSSLTHAGVQELLEKTKHLIDETPDFPLKGQTEDSGIKVYDAHLDGARHEHEFEIVSEGAREWRIIGESVVKTYRLINVSTDAGISKLVKYLDNLGIEEELERLGAKNGDTVYIDDFAFEYFN